MTTPNDLTDFVEIAAIELDDFDYLVEVLSLSDFDGSDGFIDFGDLMSDAYKC